MTATPEVRILPQQRQESAQLSRVATIETDQLHPFDYAFGYLYEQPEIQTVLAGLPESVINSNPAGVERTGLRWALHMSDALKGLASSNHQKGLVIAHDHGDYALHERVVESLGGAEVASSRVAESGLKGAAVLEQARRSFFRAHGVWTTDLHNERYTPEQQQAAEDLNRVWYDFRRIYGGAGRQTLSREHYLRKLDQFITTEKAKKSD